MKSNRGATMTALVVYIVVVTIVVISVGTLITYFNRNLKEVDASSVSDAEYLKFNMYFTDEINTKGNEVTIGEDNSYIIFSKTQNQYKFQDGKIYRNKVKICDDIQICSFGYKDETIVVNLMINSKDYSTIYTVVQEIS